MSIQIVPVPGQAAEEAKPDAAAAEKEKPAEEAAPKEETPEEKAKKFAEELLKLKFNRSPEAILEVTRARRKDEELTPVEEFNRAVMFGDWKAVGTTLASLPPEEAKKVYHKLITTLGEQSVPVGMLLREPDRGSDEEDPFETRNRLQQERRELEKRPAPLLSEDFYALVDAAPGEITEDDIGAIAKLAQVSLGEGGRGSLNAKLKPGWQGIGGETKEGGLLATRLLSALGWIRDAAPFLPLDEAKWDDADATQLVYVMEYFTKTGIEDRDERLLARAASACARLMKSSRIGNYTRPQFRLAMERLVNLLPALDPEAAKTLIREQLFSQSASLADLISFFGEQGQKLAKEQDLQARAASLGTQHLILESLVPMEGALPPNVAVLALNWLAEAEGCYRAGGVVATDMTQAQRMMMRRYGFGRQGEVDTLSTEQIMRTAPPADLIPRLNPGLGQRVRLTLLKLEVLDSEKLDLSMLRQYVKDHPGLERQMCQDILAAWVSKQSKPAESEQVKQMRAYGYYIPPQMLQAGAGIPLTRLRQKQNIEQLKDLLGELRKISPEPLDPALIVEAFMALHSGAEVYQLDDIIAIFGPPESMVRAELLTLLEGMRGRLGEEWRDPQAQQQAGTKRTEKEMKDEVSRGYRTALELAKRGVREEDSDWKSFITRGRLFYDASQYEFDRQIKLTDYVELRDEAFGSFRKAAELYAGQLPSMPTGQWTIEPYQSWFFVMLGASDLAQLTSNTARTDPGLQSIGDAMRALPGEAAEKHVAMFAEMLGTVFPQVPANVRQRFLNSGLKIVGEDNPAAAAATKSLDYYRELLDEIQLRVTVDGPTEVGHGRPFGLFIGLETTRQLLRESGGFNKYLQNQANQMQAMMGGGSPDARNLRDDFTKNIHAALDETFEVVSITFHDASVKAVDLPREGWVETPLAYAVLRSKNAAVDRIPSIQIDMDFVDQPGQVVLPVLSQVQPIDARADSPPERPCPELTLAVTMDQREWKDGSLVVEIAASGQGIIGELGDLFDYEREGFEAEVVDSSLAITEFTSDGKSRTPHADRNWQVTYRRKADPRGGVRFPFPTPKSAAENAAVEYKLYQDADLVEVSPEDAKRGVALDGAATSYGKWIAGLVILGLAGGGAWLARRGSGPAKAQARQLSAPEDPTPFSTVAFLRRVRSTCADLLSEAEKTELTAQIDEIEATCFRPGETPAPDLSSIVKRWGDVSKRAA
ncbi:MAG: hypothetical protein H7A50_14420 [Akkermansiaceae bacterium]|nr:hypothetical protein [Akkermansiaceae bacterium]